jgi:hypothetical protein
VTEEGADFAPQRLGGRRAPPLLAWVAALVAIVAIGFAGRAGSEAGGGGATSAPRTAAPAVAEATPVGLPAAPATARPIAQNPRASVDEGPIHLELVRTRASIYVHADLHAAHVAWVFVQVQDDAGRVAGWASMSFPGSVDPPADAVDGEPPALRFDVELVIPDDMTAGRLWTQVTVYDNLGQRTGTARLAVPTATVDDTVERDLIRGYRPTGPPWSRETPGGG